MAHNAQYPGNKIPWAPLIQSTEGAGKNALKYVMAHVMGNNYLYTPNAKELNDSGSKFNGWMERKTFFVVDEIKTDEKRELVDTLKPMITEKYLEIQSKGKDQKLADNVANWMFFSNHKDAIPINDNSRRFAILYCAIQSHADLISNGMNQAYFTSLYGWLGEGTHKFGLKIVANYLLNYPIEKGAIPMRAPFTTSKAEALVESRGWLEAMIAEAIDAQLPGFKGGWISTAAVTRILRENERKAEAKTISKSIEALGYHRIRQTNTPYFSDDPKNPAKRGVIWCIDPHGNIQNYPIAQGYL